MLDRPNIEHQIERLSEEGNRLDQTLYRMSSSLTSNIGSVCIAKQSLLEIISKIKSFYIFHLQCSFEDIKNSEIFTLKELETSTLTKNDNLKLTLTLEVLRKKLVSDFSSKEKQLSLLRSSSKAVPANNEWDALKEQVRLLRAELDELKKERRNSSPTKRAGLFP